MAFAGNSDAVLAAITILKELGGVPKLVGDSEWETIVNSITLDTQQNTLVNFIKTIDEIKSGALHDKQ